MMAYQKYQCVMWRTGSTDIWKAWIPSRQSINSTALLILILTIADSFLPSKMWIIVNRFQNNFWASVQKFHLKFIYWIICENTLNYINNFHGWISEKSNCTQAQWPLSIDWETLQESICSCICSKVPFNRLLDYIKARDTLSITDIIRGNGIRQQGSNPG